MAAFVAVGMAEAVFLVPLLLIPAGMLPFLWTLRAALKGVG